MDKEGTLLKVKQSRYTKTKNKHKTIPNTYCNPEAWISHLPSIPHFSVVMYFATTGDKILSVVEKWLKPLFIIILT